MQLDLDNFTEMFTITMEEDAFGKCSLHYEDCYDSDVYPHKKGSGTLTSY